MSDYKIYKNVVLGMGVEIGQYSVIGLPPKSSEESELKTLLGKNSIIRSHTVIYAGNIIGENFQTGHGAFLREDNRVGNNVSVGTKSIIEHHVVIEDNVRIHSQAFIPEFTVLRKGCWIGPNVVLTNAKYPLAPNVKDNLEGPVIGENAIIGANSTILPGVKIGKKAIVGAGSVVIKDVADNVVVAGNPARVIKTRTDLPYNEK